MSDNATERATVKVTAVSEQKTTKKGAPYVGFKSEKNVWYNVALASLEKTGTQIGVGSNLLVDFVTLGTSKWTSKIVVLPEGEFVGKPKSDNAPEYDASKTGTPVYSQAKDYSGLVFASNIMRISLATGEGVDGVYAKIKEIYAGIQGK